MVVASDESLAAPTAATDLLGQKFWMKAACLNTYGAILSRTFSACGPVLALSIVSRESKNDKRLKNIRA